MDEGVGKVNWKNWWQRLFGDEFKENTDSEQPLIPGETDYRSSFVGGPGRFQDTRHEVKVRMLSQYPEGMRKVSRSSEQLKSSDQGQSAEKPDFRKSSPVIRPETPNEATEAKKSRKRPPFRPSKVPSPVFGFQKPPDDFYRTADNASFFLDTDKEILERKQIHEAKAKERLAATPVLPSREDGPVLESEIAEEPSLKRLSAKEPTPSEESHKPDHPAADTGGGGSRSEALHDKTDRPASDKPLQTHQPIGRSGSEEEDTDSSENETPGGAESVQPLPAGTRLNRSLYHNGTASKVPFNVLMFRRDRTSPSDSPRLRRQEPAADSDTDDRYGSLRLPLSLLDDPPDSDGDSEDWISQKQKRLAETLTNFHVSAKVIGCVQGPSVTRFDIQLHPGVKINKVVRLSEDIKLSLAVRQIRIAPVPGKSAVGIEIPNELRKPVVLKQLLGSAAFRESRKPLTVALGQDVSGNQIVTDLATMPHGLIAGATGSGKSVCIHSLIISLIYRNSPSDVRLLLIDPKVVELAPYQQIPHLAAPVITEPKEAALALKWAVEEMETRYRKFAAEHVRDIEGYNKALRSSGGESLPYLVIIIDELADLMMTSPQEVEESVCRIAQKARAAGIHLLLATQRPSVDVITGLIKSNIPTRIAFSVSSQADSRTILDCGGAERLLGRGDMLFSENGMRGQQRLQGCFVSDEEINRVTARFADSQETEYLFSPEDLHELSADAGNSEDDLLDEAAAFVIEQGQASVSSLQRHFRIGYNRAARLVEDLESRNVVSGANGSKPRRVLITEDHYNNQ
jgi:DNA segregation ATPase FtsK/SpoIIIE and related proteins